MDKKRSKKSKVDREEERILDFLSDEERMELTERLNGVAFDSVDETEKMGKAIKLGDLIEDIYYKMENFGKIEGLSTGYRVVDEMTMGLAPGELTIVAAPTSVGKTTFCINIASNLAVKDHKVGFITLEMTSTEIGTRLYSIMGDENIEKIDNIIVNDSEKMTPQAVEVFIKNSIKDFGIEALFIDHLHYFSRDMENQANELGVITQEFKRMAIKYKIPIILVSHTRKTDVEGKEREATMSDLRGSSYIAQDADIVLVLNKVYKDGGNGKIVDPDFVKITLEKNRNRFKVPIGSAFNLGKYGLKIRDITSEELISWARNYPQQKTSQEKGFYSHASVSNSNSTVSEPKTAPTTQNLRNSGGSDADKPSNVSMLNELF